MLCFSCYITHPKGHFVDFQSIFRDKGNFFWGQPNPEAY